METSFAVNTSVTNVGGYTANVGVTESGPLNGRLGFCWSSTNPQPTTSDRQWLQSTYNGTAGKSYFFGIGFLPNTPCYVRGLSISSAGEVTYGKIIRIDPVPTDDGFSTGTFTDDRTENTFRTITVKGQTIMVDNFTFNSETAFDWYQAKDLAPPGWHVPSGAELLTLTQTIKPPYGLLAPDLMNVPAELNRFWSSPGYMTSEDNNRGWGFTDMLSFTVHWYPLNCPKTYKHLVRYIKD
jgi:hypothetical protein